jgi:pyrimidine-nucleoside phosphorylase
MFFPPIIEKKRDRQPLTREEIVFFVDGYTNGRIPNYQAAALLMAIFLNGMSNDETTWLTEAMLHSGRVMDLSAIPGIKVDKHSTGGVGDKTSLIIAPICAAAGVPVPMISGRGLGHTGGTLDKLEAIPGFKVDIGLDRYQQLIERYGLCLIGQTAEIAPADKQLYALRDVTATVENVSLIAASIMSKKLAEGIDALVLDVKTGRGAFMKTVADAQVLASLLISIGQKMGKEVTALITAMDQPLGRCVGNALEVVEAVEILRGQCRPEQRDLQTLSLALAARMIWLGKKADTLKAAEALARQLIDDGSAFDKFQEIVEQQGGDPESLTDIDRLPHANGRFQLTADRDGFIERLDALAIGQASVALGAGRETLDSVIDPAVGVVLLKKVGDPVEAGETVLEIHYNSNRRLEIALPLFQPALSIRSRQPEPLCLIYQTLP